MKILAWLTIALLVASPAAARKKAVAPTAPASGVLIDHVNGYTLDDKGTVLRFTGVLIGDDGKVSRLLSGDAAAPTNLRFRLDAGGRTLLPGLVAGNAHIVQEGLAELLKTTTEPHAVERITAAQKNGGEGLLPRERDAAVMAGQTVLLSRGFTTAIDTGTGIEDWLSMRRVGDGGHLRSRIIAYGRGIDATLAIGGPRPTAPLYDDRLRLIGLSLNANRDARSPEPAFSDSQIRNLMSRASMDSFQVALSVSSVPAYQQAVDAFAELSDTYKGDRRWRIERSGVQAPADVHFKSLGGIENSAQPSLSDDALDLAALTIKPAYAAFAEARVGSLTPGHYADFIFVDRDVIAAPGKASVTEAWISGARVWVSGSAAKAD